MKPEPSILAKSWFLNKRIIFFDLLLPSDMEYHILIKNFLNSRILNPKRSSYLELRCRTEKDVPLLDLSRGDEFILHFPERSFFINVERMHFWNKLKSAAKRAAHVDGWQDNPIYGKLLSVKEQVKMPAIDESYESRPKASKKK